MSSAAPTTLPDDPVVEGNDLITLLQRRWDGSFAVDPWGLDADVVHLASRMARLRWRVDVSGAGHVPADGPVVLVCNRRLGWSEPGVLVAALGRQVDRHIRPVGCPDLDPLGAGLRRFGALPAHPDDVAGALRTGAVVALPTARELVRFRAGTVPVELLEPAIEIGAVVLPVAVTGWEIGRRWSVAVGAPITRPRGTGPRAVAQVAVGVAAGLDALLVDAATSSLWNRTRQRFPGLRSAGS